MTRKTNKKPISRNYAVKSDDDPKTNKTNIQELCCKSDDDPKTNKKPISRNYAVKGDDDPKTNKKPISRSYAVKSDDDPKTKLLAGKLFYPIFFRGAITQN